MPSGLSEEDVVALARQHLNLSSSALIPKAYTEELRYHLAIHPDDTLFRVTLEPGKGYGKVTCLEQGCNKIVIPLVKRLKAEDGGIKDGLGSLSAYRIHIAQHPTHSKNRLNRINSQKAPGHLTSTADKSLHSYPISSSSTTPTVATNAPRRMSSLIRIPSLDSITPEPVESVIPHKRLSTHIGSGNGATLSENTLCVSPKRLKLEAPKTPFSQVNSNSKENILNCQEKVPVASVEESQTKLREVQDKIRIYQAALDRLQSKSRKNKADQSRMYHHITELARLRRFEDEYNNTQIFAPSESVARREPAITRLPTSFSRIPGDPFVSSSSLAVSNPFSTLTADPLPTSSHRVGLDPSLGFPSSSPSITPNFFAGSEDPPPSSSRRLKPFTEVGDFFSSPVNGLDGQISLPQISLPTSPVAFTSSPPPVIMPPTLWDDDAMNVDYDPTLPSLQLYGSAIPDMAPMRDSRDENGDFYGRGHDTFIGPQARADDIDKFLVEAGNSEQFDGNASVDQALKKLGLKTQYQLLPGMEVALMPHQTIGVAWMLDKEQSSFKGASLCDEMGLGKTIQMIAILTQNRSKDPKRKTTLIITPTSLLDQWKLEIEMKTNARFKCLIYHGPNKPRKKQDILDHDVVITTYTTMALEWPDHEAEQKAKLKALKKGKRPNSSFLVSDSDEHPPHGSKRKRPLEAGLLFQIEFHRIVLDEAQTIRNRKTRTSRAVTELQARYRWCLTGTPIVNSLGDAYPYLRFLKVRPWYDFTEFQGHVGRLEKKNPKLAVTRLQAILATCLLRRVKSSMLDGKRLIELPEKTVMLTKLEFTEEERQIYRAVEAKSQAIFNRYLRAGTVLKNYTSVLALLLRLRQICSHPCLISEEADAFVAPEEWSDWKPEISTELTRAKRLVSAEFVERLKKKFTESVLRRMEAEKKSPEAVIEDEECPICFDQYANAVVTSCSHIFCRECILNVINTAVIDDRNDGAVYQANERPCPVCRSPICEQKLFSRSAFEPSDKELGTEGKTTNSQSDNDEDEDPYAVFRRTRNAKAKGKSRGKRIQNMNKVDVIHSDCEYSREDDEDDLSDFIVHNEDVRRVSKKRRGKRRAIVLDSEDEMSEEEDVILGAKKDVPGSKEQIKMMPRFLPSTKMKSMMETLRKLAKERPDEKTIVVSQWTSCLSLVSDYLTEAGVPHVKYQGDMNRTKRDQVVRVFMSNNSARVMLMSLKCGGVGLNLTRANNVISLDLGWSQAVEAQAFDRCHRLGQTRPVSIHRLVIADTVEDRVLALQERKQHLADGSLGEGNAQKIGRLSVRELAHLFGLDHRGRVLNRC